MARYAQFPRWPWEVYHPAYGLLIVQGRDKVEAVNEAAREWRADPQDPNFLADVRIAMHIKQGKVEL